MSGVIEWNWIFCARSWRFYVKSIECGKRYVKEIIKEKKGWSKWVGNFSFFSDHKQKKKKEIKSKKKLDSSSYFLPDVTF